MIEHRTVWRLRALDYPNPPRSGLDVQLVVDTTAPVVVAAIERAAASAGIELERIEGLDEEGSQP